MPEVSPQQRAEEGKRAYGRKDYQAAARVFAEAAEMFTVAGDRLSAAEMKNNQCVALLQEKQAQAALDAVVGSDAVFAAAGDIRRQAMALANQAAALEALKRSEEAIACYGQSSSLLEEAGEGDLRADVMRVLAALQMKRGKTIDAVVSMQSGVAGVKKPSLKQWILKKLLRFPKWW